MDQCPLCLDKLTKPVTLPCLHTFCCACLIPTIEKGSEESKCPLCRTAFPNPQDGTLSHLSCPPYLLHLLNSSTSTSFPSSAIDENQDPNHLICEICEESEAERGCENCEQFLCGRCAQFHAKGKVFKEGKKERRKEGKKERRKEEKRKANEKGKRKKLNETTMKSIKLTASHQLVDLEVMLSREKKGKEKIWKCESHPEEEMRLFCNTCKLPSCPVCVVFKHQKHDLQLIGDVAKEYWDQINSEIAPIQTKASIIEEALLKIDKNLQDASQFAESTTESIFKSFKKLREAIDFRESQLLQTVESTRNVKEKQLRLQKETGEFLLNGIQAAMLLSSSLLANGSSFEITSTFPLISKRLEALRKIHFEPEPCQEPNMEFSLERVGDFEELIGNVGQVNLSLSTTVPSLSCVEMATLPPAVVPDAVFSFKVISMDSNSERVEKGGDHYKAVLSGPEQTDITVSDHGNGTYTFSTSTPLRTMGKYTITITLRGEEIQGSPVFFSVAMQRNYQRISAPRLRVGGKGSDEGHFDSPRAVASNSAGEIIVADTTNRRIQILDKDGKFIFAIGDNNLPRKKEWIINPYGVAIDQARGDRILVADTDHHRVLVYSREGGLLFSFGKEGEGEGEFKLPFGLAVNREGEIIVSDQRNHRIQVFDENGNFLRRFGTYGMEEGELSGPSGVAVDSKGRILISEHLNFRVQVFDRFGKFVKFIGKGKMKNPYHLAVDPFDRVIVSDFGGSSVVVFDWEDKLLGNFANGIKTTGVWVDGDEKIYVCSRDTHEVLIF